MSEEISVGNFIITPEVAFWIGWFAKQASVMQDRYDSDSLIHKYEAKRSYQLIFWLTSSGTDDKTIYKIIVRVGGVENIYTAYRILCEFETQVAADIAYSKLQQFYAEMKATIENWSTYNNGP